MSAHVPTHQRVERPPMDRALLVLLAAVVVTGGVCLVVTASVPAADRGLVAACTGIAALALCAALSAAAYGFQSARVLRERVETMEAQTARLADETLPAVVKRLRDGASGATAMASIEQPAAAEHRRILRAIVDEIARGERMRAAAMSVCANAAGRVQALATSMLADLREMENRHDEEVLGDLLKLDHTTAQAGRLADSIAVLTGARSGRRWTKPIVMESILRGAVGRISAYQRVRVHSTSTVAVAGYAAEGVMHALAELMDNATSFSPPSEEVHVYVEEVHAGVVVTIEDGGLAMSAAALERAERAVSAETLDLTTLSGTRLGLAVVGCLARKHGLTVSFRPSSRGGTGVVVLVPRSLITQPAPGAEPSGSRVVGLGARRTEGATAGPDTAAAPARPVALAEPPAPFAAANTSGTTAEATAVTPAGERTDPATGPQEIIDIANKTIPDGAGTVAGLPRRRKGQTLAAAAKASEAPKPRVDKPTTDPGARFSAFREAGRRRRTSGDAPAPKTDQS
ncbi:ATP-binding protein [Actinoallomurus soli]|uniref:ATP-binding protein n=1 Tax=Actinoallomurus soli TaxID=2952535 RepID=UPI002091E9BB|nr:ATP-binding protein [Actinoallomurus soli]MCO5972920.1 ATP-binding protein [Actinoallomurus soli]